MIICHVNLVFVDQTHRAIHDLLLGRGFKFEVSPSMQVGLRYWHHSKPLQVTVTIQDNECWTTIYDTTRTPQIVSDLHYSAKEWDWLITSQDDVIAFLNRELYILFDVRPNYMIRPPS